MHARRLNSTKLEEITYLPEKEDILIWHSKGLESKEKSSLEHQYSSKAKKSSNNLKLQTKLISPPDTEKQTKLINKFHTIPEDSKTNVFDRLLDPKLYTGMHKYRFDKDGNGLGKAGREYLFREDGYTESTKRRHEVVCSSIKRHSYANISSNDFLQKAKVIWLYKNADKYDKGTIYYVKPYIRNMTQLLNEINRNVRLLGGPVRALYDQGLKQINGVSEIVDGAKYLCTSGEQPTSIEKLENFLSYWIIHK
ncbi:Doublecortin/p25-alpha domain containing protein [Cryptosporidium meleagridis]